MQSTRKITYGSVSGTGGPTEIYSSASTWGELKAAYPGLAAASMGMSAIVYNTQSKLTLDSDTLPTGDFSILLALDKNNSGNN